LENFPLITAHAGCENTARDSIESVRAGIALGADIVEVDVRLSSFGTLVFSHDKKIDEEYACGDDIAAAFAAILDTPVGVNCDIKEERAIFPVLKLADRFGIPRERFILTGLVIPQFLKNAPEIIRRASVFMNVENVPHTDTASLADSCLALGVSGVNMPLRFATQESLSVFAEKGLPASVWTVDDPSDRKRLLAAKVYNITTRKVFDALRERAQLAL